MKRQNIGISEETHTKIKIYCVENKLKLSKKVEEIIIQFLEKTKK